MRRTLLKRTWLSAVLVPDLFEGKHDSKTVLSPHVADICTSRWRSHAFEAFSAGHSRCIEKLDLVELASRQIASGEAAGNVPSLALLPQTRPEETTCASPGGCATRSSQGRSLRILLWRRRVVACVRRTQAPRASMLHGSPELSQAKSTRPSINEIEPGVRGRSGRPLHIAREYP